MRTTEDARNAPDMNEVLMVLGSYLVWAADTVSYHGGYSGEEALAAFQQLLGWDDERMKKFVQVFIEDQE